MTGRLVDSTAMAHVTSDSMSLFNSGSGSSEQLAFLGSPVLAWDGSDRMLPCQISSPSSVLGGFSLDAWAYLQFIYNIALCRQTTPPSFR